MIFFHLAKLEQIKFRMQTVMTILKVYTVTVEQRLNQQVIANVKQLV